MYKKILFGLIGGLLFALPVAAASPAAEWAQTANPEDCRDCHQITYNHWEASAHAKAVSDEAFQILWAENGHDTACLACHTTGYDPETGSAEVDSIACSTCHFPFPETHPEQIMPTDISSRMCGDCHLETFAQFEMSVHRENELACVNCHDAHGTSIKTETSTELCAVCHQDYVHFFSYTPHAEEGLTCVDCHLMVEGGVAGEGHGTRRHTFTVSLDSCKDCHGGEMHYPNPSGQTAHPEEDVQAGFLPGTEQAYEGNPMQFVLLAAVVGMGAGLILSPWIERWYARVSAIDERS